jgi:hypothetical protein
LLIDMTYDEATAVVEELVPDFIADPGDWRRAGEGLQAVAEQHRLDAIRPACALATIWRADRKKAGFVLPTLETVGLVEYLISEPVFERRYTRHYGTDSD